MVDLSAEFIEEGHFLSARILNELNKIKQLTAPKKSYFVEFITWMEYFIVRQHTWLVHLSGKTSVGVPLWLVRERPKPAKMRKDVPRPDDSPKKAVSSGSLYFDVAQRGPGDGKTVTSKMKKKKKKNNEHTEMQKLLMRSRVALRETLRGLVGRHLISLKRSTYSWSIQRTMPFL